MIGQVLNRDFVLGLLPTIKKDLHRASTETEPAKRTMRGPGITFNVERVDFANALQSLNSLDLNSIHGQPSFDVQSSALQSENRVPVLDDFAFLCWDPVVSLVQSAIERYYIERQPHALKRITPVRTGLRTPSQEAMVTDLFIKGDNETGTPPKRIFNQFSITDIRWVSSWLAEGIRFLRGKHPFKAEPATPYPIRDNARIILVGDWGTGLPRAKKVAKQMRKEIIKAKDEGVQLHVIHLGDVYYSGWKDEYVERFLADDCWPVKKKEADVVTSWSLNGNHDMYSGGYGYYDILLRDERFKRQECSSFFSLCNNHWEILGLDTSFDNEDLKDPQAEWVTSKIHASTRNIVLLSHHQLFSAYESGCPKVRTKLESALRSNHIRAWFWGHEHRHMGFKPSDLLPCGRCLGHGGVPVYMSHETDDPYPEPGNYEFRSFKKVGREKWALFGFAVLDLRDDHISATYIDENGASYRKEAISS